MIYFRFFSALGLLLSLIDFIGLLTSSPICKADGCLLVNQTTPYGSIPFTIAGIVFFTTLFVLSFYKKLHFVIDYLLSLALPVEGALLGYQAFFLQKFCLVCVSIAGIIAVLFYIYIRIPHRNKLAYLFFLFSVSSTILLLFLGVFLYTPAQNPNDPAWVPLQGKTLIYSKDCSHCEDLIDKIKKNKITGIRFVRLRQAKNYLALNGITIVPVLIDKKENSVKILTGETSIFQWLDPPNNLSNGISFSADANKTNGCSIDNVKKCN